MNEAAAAERKLYDAASKGDLTAFQEVIKEDAYLLEETTFACSRNLLHIATMRGQTCIVEEVLKMNPQLAQSLDSQNSSPLHIAAAKGHVEVAKKLLSVAPEMCWLLDCQNMNPIHIAAMNGHVEILEELLQIDYLPAMERVHRGQTVLHLCVKHRQLRALKVLVEKLGELVDAKDEDGETILHWAVRSKHFEMIRYLVEDKKIKELTTNSMGKTALKILKESPTNDYLEIKKLLLRLWDASMVIVHPEMTENTRVVMALIATMAFQAAVSPPGGVWQDDSTTHKAGEAVMASTHPRIYKHFVRANTTAFISSIVTLLFITTTRFPSEFIYIMTIAVYAMWVSLASIAVSYGVSITVISPNTETQSGHHIIWIVVAVSLTIYEMIAVWVFIQEFSRVYIQELYSLWKTKIQQYGSFIALREKWNSLLQALQGN